MYACIVKRNMQKDECSVETTDEGRQILRRCNKNNTKGTKLKNEIYALKS